MSEVFVSAAAHPLLLAYLRAIGHRVVPVKAGEPPPVYAAVSCHPDIYMCKLGAMPDAPVYMGERSRLTLDYPGNIRYNAVAIGKYFIHNLRYTDPVLLKCVTDFTKINVKQGYTKCNVAVIDERRLITSDRGIYKAVRAAAPELEVLLIAEGQVLLPGLPGGFLGGTCGRVGARMIFNGDLSAHSDFSCITRFIAGAGLETVYFKEYRLTDIGSIIERTT